MKIAILAGDGIGPEIVAGSACTGALRRDGLRELNPPEWLRSGPRANRFRATQAVAEADAGILGAVADHSVSPPRPAAGRALAYGNSESCQSAACNALS
jgi:isocitrate/isopropylmalate dehydrogenase